MIDDLKAGDRISYLDQHFTDEFEGVVFAVAEAVRPGAFAVFIVDDPKHGLRWGYMSQITSVNGVATSV